jgi:hypothetical protein
MLRASEGVVRRKESKGKEDSSRNGQQIRVKVCETETVMIYSRIFSPFVQQNTSWQTDSRSASHWISTPCIWNQKVHYRVHEARNWSLAKFPSFSSQFLFLRSILMLSHLRRGLSCGFFFFPSGSHVDTVIISLLPDACYIPSQSCCMMWSSCLVMRIWGGNVCLVHLEVTSCG